MRNIILPINSQSIKVYLCYKKSIRFLLIKVKDTSCRYFILPKSIYGIQLIDKNLCIKTSLKKNNFLVNTLNLYNKKVFAFRQKIILKGLGFKIFYNDTLNELSFKLGYSHLIYVKVPQGVQFIKILKNILIVSSFDAALLGNFVFNIQKLRYPDSYKGKGFRLKRQILRINQLKKK